MSLETHLNTAFEYLISQQQHIAVTSDQLIQCIDLTLLDMNASEAALLEMNQLAKTNKVAAICVFAHHLPLFNPASEFQLATVINFPHGTGKISQSLLDIEQAITMGAQEIDYVFPYQMYLGHQKTLALEYCESIAQVCKKHGLVLKVILETGAFPDMPTIYQVSGDLISMGCDFLKTSTGKIPRGASVSAVFAILSAIKDSGKACGVKVSGGVKTPQQAQNYAYLAELILGKSISKEWFRIGASSLLNELLVKV